MITKNLVLTLRTYFVTLLLIFAATGANTAFSANITAFGDSITEGWESDTGGYPPKLSALLNGNKKPAVVANFGIGGEQTPAGYDRFDSVLAAFPANIILIMEGTNDVHVGISLETTKFNLGEMVKKAKAAKVIPVLATLTPSNRGDSETLIPNLWNPMIKALASSNGVKLSDQYAGILPVWGSANADGIHPNDAGYQIIANTWYATIGPMITAEGTIDTGGGGSSGCFIATAAFGSPLEKHVAILKEFRDRWLLTNDPGRQFVATYYQLSPPVADFISQHEGVKLAVRVLLYPLVALGYVLLNISGQIQLLALVVLAASVAGTVVLYRRRPLA